MSQCHQVKEASAGRVGPKGRIETKRAAFAMDFALHGSRRGFDTLASVRLRLLSPSRYSTDGA